MVDVLDPAPAEPHVGVGGSVAGGVDVLGAGPHRGVDDDAVVDLEAGGLGEAGARDDADPDDGQVGLDLGAVLEPDRNAVLAGVTAVERAVDDLDAVVGQGVGDAAREPLGEEPLLHEVLGQHHRDLHVVLDQRRRHLGADVAAAHHDRVRVRPEQVAQLPVVGRGAVGQHPRAGRQAQRAGLGSGREQDLAVGDARAVGERDGVGAGVDRGGLGVRTELHAVGRPVEQRLVLERSVVLEPQVLRQHRPVDRRVGLGAQEEDAAGVVDVADPVDRLRGGDAGTDDHVVVGGHVPTLASRP